MLARLSSSRALVSPLKRCMASLPPAVSDRGPIDVSASDVEYFPGIGDIKYEGPESLNPMAFKHYNADEVVGGKTMRDWTRFAVCYWHTFRGVGVDPFGGGTIIRPWDNASADEVENALYRADAAFEFFTKLGVDYYCFHDVDVAPFTDDYAQSCDNFDAVADRLEANQKKTGVKLLWGTANLFSHPRFMNGAGTNPDFHSFAYACAQVKKAMEVTARLGGENYVFWGGREGYQSILNTDIRQELDHAAAFFQMAVNHKKSLGTDFQLLIEPKPREPTKHQYDYDAATVISFLKTYGLENDFKLNIEPNHTTLAGHDYNHDIWFASKYGMLGSIDANTGDELLGWDTDQFLTDFKRATLVMKVIMEQGGLAPGGLNFDAKVRRESVNVEDLFLAHISSMDALAFGLRAAAKIREEGILDGMVADRYSSFKGKDLSSMSFEDAEAFVRSSGEPPHKSSQQELYEIVLNRYMVSSNL